MDAFYTDVRRRPRSVARGAWAAGRTRCGPTPRAATRNRSKRTASAARRQDGTEQMSTRQELIARSNRLGSDPKNTNYAGGNTSAKGTETDPVTGEPVELLWVKGSGGDLGTLTESGLAVLRLDRMRALVDVYPGVDREDEMVAAFDYCLHGKGGAAPSIDTAMHGLVDAAHVDHLHPDCGIAIATAADGEQLTSRSSATRSCGCRGAGRASSSASTSPRSRSSNPKAIGCILGGHGITAWGDTSEKCEKNSLWIIRTAEKYIKANSQEEPVRCPREEVGAAQRRQAPGARRRARRHAARRRVAGPADGRSLHRRQGRARLPGQPQPPTPGRARHVVPRPLPAHQGQADGRRPARPTRLWRRSRPASPSCTRPTAPTTPATTTATRSRGRPRCAAPTR